MRTMMVVAMAMALTGCSTAAPANCSANLNGVSYTPGSKSPVWCFAYETSLHMLDIEVRTGVGDDGVDIAVQDNIPTSTFLSLSADVPIAPDGSNSAQMNLHMDNRECSAFTGAIDASGGKDGKWLLKISSVCTLDSTVTLDGDVSVVIQ